MNKNLTFITALVNAGANPDAGDQHGRAPLHWAARWSADPATMTTLVELGADPNNRDERARTPLHRGARWTRNPAVITALLDAGAAAHTRDDHGNQPSHYATNNEAIKQSKACERLCQ